jgi:hypothetical protein
VDTKVFNLVERDGLVIAGSGVGRGVALQRRGESNVSIGGRSADRQVAHLRISPERSNLDFPSGNSSVWVDLTKSRQFQQGL